MNATDHADHALNAHSPVKLACLITGLTTGGAETVLCLQLKYLDRSRYQPVVICINPLAEMAERIAALGIPVYSLNMRRKFNLLALARLYRMLKIIRPQILHAHMFHSILLGRVIGRLAGVPVVISTLHSSQLGGRVRGLWLRLTNRLSPLITTVSHASATALLEAGIARPEWLAVIINGVETGAYPAAVNAEDKVALRRRLQLPEGKYLLLAVGRLHPAKGYRYLIDCMAILLAQGLDCCLAIAGEGELRRELQQQSAELGLKDRVLFLGLRKDVPELMAAADLYVLSSLGEGLPMAAIEAMAAGLPVVATAVGGLKELVEEGVTGLLVPPRSAGQLAEAISRLLSLPPEKREEMGRQARERAVNKYSAAAMAAAYEEIYARCLAAGENESDQA